MNFERHLVAPTRAHHALRWLALFALVLTTAPSLAAAQGFTRRALPGGAITGLELTLEGPQSVEAGQRARWFVALHEVVRDQAYRPASGANIQVLASYQYGEPVADVLV